jgi:hypothetical protein
MVLPWRQYIGNFRHAFLMAFPIKVKDYKSD